MHRGNHLLAQNGGRELSKRFKVLEFLGKGSYGSVYRVQRRENGIIYAVKEMDVKGMDHEEKQGILNEVRLLASVRHPNIVCYHEAFVDGSRLCIVMEYAAGGDLATTIKKHRASRKPMAEDLIWKYFIQIARGLEALHNLKIIHRDIKPGNILVTKTGHVKIADLGIAKHARNNMAKTQIGTPVYMAPEVWCKKPYTFSSDLWSMGCVLYEMATYNIPFDGRSLHELKQKILRGIYAPIPSYYGKEVVEMVKICMSMRPESRPTMTKVLNTAAVKKRLKLVPSGQGTPGGKMIDTIKLPRHKKMEEVRLPPAMYSMEIDENELPPVDPKHYRPPSRAPSRVPSRNGLQQPERAQKQQNLPVLYRRPSEFNRAHPHHHGNQEGGKRGVSRGDNKLPPIPGVGQANPRPPPQPRPRNQIPSAQGHRRVIPPSSRGKVQQHGIQRAPPAWNYAAGTKVRGGAQGRQQLAHPRSNNPYGQYMRQGVNPRRYH